MKINKKSIQLIGFLFLFSIVYLLVAIEPARSTLQFIPQWTIDIENGGTGLTSSQDFPYKLGAYMGYFTSEGSIGSLQLAGEKGSISNYYAASYAANASQTTFFNPKGEQSGVLAEAGFPFFDEDRIFLFYPTGNTFSHHSSTGQKKWAYENYVPITSFFSNENGVVAGYADGEVVVFNLEGDILQEFFPGGSEYEIIFGASLSSSGKYVACLSGLDKQRIVIADIVGNTSKIMFHTYVENAVSNQTLVYFSENEKYVFVNVKDSLVAINIDTKKEHTIPIDGKVITIKEIYDGEYYFVLSKYRNENTIHVFNTHLHRVGQFSFGDSNAFLDSDNENVYIGNGTTISKVFVQEN